MCQKIFISEGTAPISLNSLPVQKKEIKNQGIHVASRVEKWAFKEEGCEEYTTTSAGKVCLVSSVLISQKNDLLRNKERTEDTIDPQNLRNKFNLNDAVLVREVEVLNEPKIEAVKVEPGTIFIPFHTDDCGWFCK